MAFLQAGLSRIQSTGSIGIGAGSVKSVLHYATNDDAAAVQATGYFNDAAGLLALGDVVFASLDLDSTPALKNYIVSANTGSVVTIAAQTTA